MENEHSCTPSEASEFAVKASVALSYIPCIFMKLDADCREMLAMVLQAMRDGGYEDGFRDGKQSAEHKWKKEDG